MYDFDPTDEQQMLMDTVARFAEKDLRGIAHDADEAGIVPAEVIKKGWQLGVLQASIPEAYGGFGERSAVTGVLAAEALAWGDMAAALAIMAPSTYALPVLTAGSEEQKRELLPPVIEGEWQAYTAAFIEPDFDFYSGEMRTTAKADGQSYILEGVKAMVPFADAAKGMLVYAALDGKTQAFVVPSAAEGLHVLEREKLLGLGAVPLFRVGLEALRVPRAARLGPEAGHDPEPVVSASCVAIAAMAVGLSRAAYEYARDYAKDRVVFGSPVAQKQSVAFMLAEMAIEIEAIRLLVWEAAWTLDAGKGAGRESYLALSGAADLAMMVTDRAVQILGGHGYIREHPVERWMRNGRGVQSFSGLAMV
jgi:acyl-CoA dehydrogenase